ncbi:NAD-P-binding protein [Eremomyces bilateralis CBS 781.70]|uniref:NAD-P-binding protein n=1 Tax=Eremomyces bilateralis CBS 781.70 TaxID=1392243 RepID=A0A6G1G2I2_9PEZI|nr:NAD-P-binding protein [Eremomyces bilateralis CBS 781.70]KAF1812264.1 NAD-P-binding protein [Eremomyces bilateralis CBS 781.70]
MAPIRTALIGLRSNSTRGAGWAALAHLPYLTQSPKYQIVALLNSSKEAAEAAIKKHNLPGDTKAYGTPEELAADDEVDLVVCCTRVDTHYVSLKPILERGKTPVLCEWPLGANLRETHEMTDAVGKSGVRNVVSVQGGFSPLVTTLKALIADGKIGKVLSSNVTTSGMIGGPTTAADFTYSNERKIGGNMLTIMFGHLSEIIFNVLGDLGSFNSILHTKFPTATLVDPQNPLEVVGTQERTTPDELLLQGRLESGTFLSVHVRGGPPNRSAAVPDLVWRIYGEKGEITVSSPQPNIINTAQGITVELHDHASHKVEKIETLSNELEHLPDPARNIARLYEAYADKTWYPDFKHALKRYQLIDEMYRRLDNGQQDIKPNYA